MINIEIFSHNYSSVIDITSELLELLSYTSMRYDRRIKRMKTEEHSLIDSKRRFLTGLVPYIKENMQDVVISDARIFPTFDAKEPELNVNLRPYQIDYVIEALTQMRTVCHCSVASGKTIIIAALISILDLPTLLIVSDKTNQAQIKTELDKLLKRRFNIKIGIPRNLIKLPPKELQEYPLLIVDECHIVPAAQAMEVILKNNAPFRFGFTGTPTGRSDGRDLVIQGLIGKITKLIEPAELVEQGYLAKTEVSMHYGSFEGDYSVLEALLIVQNSKRNELLRKIIQSYRDKSVLVLIRRIEHGQLIQKMIPKSVFVYGDTSAEEREQIRQDVKDGKIKVLIASNVFSMGLDIPNLEVGINAAGGKAEILTGQRIGRVMRYWQGMCKKWIDIYDKYHPTLEAHSKERIKIYQENDTEIDFIGFPEYIKYKL
jgi:superfamily II DNA or RNA helicase